jgi:hypothetical protein
MPESLLALPTAGQSIRPRPVVGANIMDNTNSVPETGLRRSFTVFARHLGIGLVIDENSEDPALTDVGLFNTIDARSRL